VFHSECDVVKQLKDIVYENLNVFVGACVDPPNICLVWHYCPKGSLQVTAHHHYYLRRFNQSITLFVRHDITTQSQQAEFGTGKTGHEVHLQLPKQ